jgi:uncharacterized protein YdcH (DUF465 family)
MLHEYRDEIHELKMNNSHFAKIFEEHNELDQMTTDADEGRLHLTDMELETLKKKKLLLKDEALMMILKYRKELADKNA